MFRTLILATCFAVSFAGALLTSAVPAAADDDYDALMDSERAIQSQSNGAGAGKVTFNPF